MLNYLVSMDRTCGFNSCLEESINDAKAAIDSNHEGELTQRSLYESVIAHLIKNSV